MIPKITYIISDINKAVFFEKTALGLRAQGIELSFILINCKNTELSSFLEQQHFQIFHLQTKSLLHSIDIIWKCRSILIQIQPDAIHSHMAIGNWVGLWAAHFAFIKKIVFTRHAGEPLAYSVKEQVIDKIQNMLATDIIAISVVIKEILLNQGVREKKISLINHGFDIDRMINHNAVKVARIYNKYNPENQFPVIGVIARWFDIKGIQYIIPAFLKLLKSYPDAKLCLFNASESAPYSKEIKELLAKIPARNYEIVAFENNVYDLYQLFDVYVHVPVNAYCEAFGQTYIEALASGIPSIFTLSGIAREFIIDKQNALVVDYQNSEQIYEGMITLLTDQVLKETLIKNGQQNIQERFGLPVYLKNLIELYSK